MRFRLPVQLYPQFLSLLGVGDRLAELGDVGRRWVRALIRWEQGV